MKSRNGNIIPLVRLDYDEVKGMHFNAVSYDDPSKKLAAKIRHPRSASLGQWDNYQTALRNLQGWQEADNLWDMWRLSHEEYQRLLWG